MTINYKNHVHKRMICSKFGTTTILHINIRIKPIAIYVPFSPVWSRSFLYYNEYNQARYIAFCSFMLDITAFNTVKIISRYVYFCIYIR